MACNVENSMQDAQLLRKYDKVLTALGRPYKVCKIYLGTAVSRKSCTAFLVNAYFGERTAILLGRYNSHMPLFSIDTMRVLLHFHKLPMYMICTLLVYAICLARLVIAQMFEVARTPFRAALTQVSPHTWRLLLDNSAVAAVN